MLALFVIAVAGIESRVFTLDDPAHRRKIPMRATWPAGEGKAPVVVFSHGLYGSATAYDPIVKHWAEHGYVVLQPTHEDSASIEENHKLVNLTQPNRLIMKAWRSRVDDVKAVLDSFATIERNVRGLRGRLDPSRVAMAGHSFGAFTSQLIGGATALGPRFEDKRPVAIILLSPQGLNNGGRNVYTNMTRPMLVATGSKDVVKLNLSHQQTPEERRQAFESAPKGDKFLLWIDGATHNFGGISGNFNWPGAGSPNEQHVKLVKDVTTTFLDAYVRHDVKAKAALKSGTELNGATLTER